MYMITQKGENQRGLNPTQRTTGTKKCWEHWTQSSPEKSTPTVYLLLNGQL